MTATPEQRTDDAGNRAQRRARRSRVSRFARGRRTLETALLAVEEISLHPRGDLLCRAATHWRMSGSSATCFLCDAVSLHPAAHLFAWSGEAPKQAAVAGLCCDCWRGDDPTAIDEAAARVLQQVVPGGCFLDPRAVLP